MIDNSDIQAAQEEIVELGDRLEEIITHATSDQYKDSHVEEMSNFVEISEKLKELGYEPTEIEVAQSKRSLPCDCLRYQKDTQTILARFNTDELLERLPDYIQGDLWGASLLLDKALDEYRVGYYHSATHEYFGGTLCKSDTPEEALGKLYLWCLQNGYCKEVT